jgi:hypothetical protein
MNFFGARFRQHPGNLSSIDRGAGNQDSKMVYGKARIIVVGEMQAGEPDHDE